MRAPTQPARPMLRAMVPRTRALRAPTLRAAPRRARPMRRARLPIRAPRPRAALRRASTARPTKGYVRCGALRRPAFFLPAPSRNCGFSHSAQTSFAAGIFAVYFNIAARTRRLWRDVRAGRRSTIGNRVCPTRVSGVRIPISPPELTSVLRRAF